MVNKRTFAVPERSFPALAHLRASGAHALEINLGGPNDLRLSVGEIERVEAAIKAFRAEIAFEDGRTSDRTNDARKALGVF